MDLKRKAAACFVLLAFGGGLRAEFRLSDQESEIYYDFAVVAGEAIQIEKDARVTGAVHGNGTVLVKKDALVTGDVSAAGEISLVGTVTGEVTPGAAPLVLPALELAALRDRADRVFEGDTIFDDHVVIDDVVFVDGTVHFRGSVNGSGTVAATGDVRLDTVGGKMGFVLEETTRLSFVAGGDVRLGKGRPMRGVIRAGHDAQLETATVFEGVIVADRQVLVKKESSVDFVNFDQIPPSLAIISPSEPLILGDPTPQIVVEYSDNESGIDLATLAIRIDGANITGDCSAQASSAVCETPPLEEGEHTIIAMIGDLAGNLESAVFQFELLLDLEPPGVVVSSPQPGLLTNQSPLVVTGSVTDDGVVAGVTVNGVDAAIVDDTFSATVEVLGSGSRLIEVVATDGTGKTTTVPLDIVLDTLPPDLMLLAPEDGIVTHGAVIEVNGGVEDVNGIAAVEVNGIPAALAGEMFSSTIELADGTNPVTVRVRDAAGNVTTETRQVTRIALPTLIINSPRNLTRVEGSSVLVAGLIDDPTATVEVDGVPAVVSDGTFSASVPLREGINLLTARTVNAGGRSTTATVSVVRDSTPPVVVLSSPIDGTVVRQSTISVTGIVNDTASGYQGIEPIALTVNGVAASVDNRSFLLPELTLAPGENAITAVAVDPAGNSAQTRVVVHFDDTPGPRLAVVSGNHQSATVGDLLAQPLVVELTDLAGQPLSGEIVHFSVIEGNGSLNGGERQVVVATGATGRAAVDFTLGSRAGSGNHRLLARASALGLSVELSAGATAAEPAHLLVDSGDQQVGIAGQTLPLPFSAVVTDAGFNRLPGVEVLFRVIRGDGVFDDGSQEKVVISDSQGAALAVLTLGPEEGVANNIVWAMLGEEPDDPLAAFAASGRAAGDPAQTAIVGLVLDNTDRPVPGVTVEIVESGQATRTDATGFFRIPGAPVGTVHLHVDSSTAEVSGTWSSLEFVLTTLPGRENDLGRPIYVLPLDIERGLAVSETTSGTLTLPELPGFALEVEPGSVTFPDGGHTGVVSVTLVHGDKIPMVPNFSQQPRFVITVQPAGALFDPPARVTFPNVDGLAPGQVTELYSFDHDLGRFVSIGPGAVSEDGSSLVSMPGFGIVKAGWHCGGDPSGSGTTHDCPECRECVENVCVPDPGKNGLDCEDDGDRCTVDLCSDGECLHWIKKITDFEATGNGKRFIELFIRGCVQYRTRDETRHCAIDSYFWDFSNGVTSREPSPLVCYEDVGVFPWRVEVSCDDCSDNRDFGAVKVECPEITITGMDPNIDFICPGCTKQFFAETSPPGFGFVWRVPISGSLGGKATIDQNGVLSIADDAPTGLVTVEVAVANKFDEKECVDSTVVQVFNPHKSGLTVPNPSCLIFESGGLEEDAINAKDRNFPHVSCKGDAAVGNAFIHAYASCILAARCGVSAAESIGNTREQVRIDNPCQRTKMDLHNNEVGRHLGNGANEADCEDLVLNAIRNGDLRFFNPPFPPKGDVCAPLDQIVPPGSPCDR